MKIKKTAIFLMAICVFLIGTAHAESLPKTITIPVQATIVKPDVTLEPNGPGLNFGQILPDTEKDVTITINAKDVQLEDRSLKSAIRKATVPGEGEGTTVDANHVFMNSYSTGSFILSSDLPAKVTINFDPSIDLKMAGWSDTFPPTITVDDIHTNSSWNPSTQNSDGLEIAPNTEYYIHIGGRLVVKSDQPAGIYTVPEKDEVAGGLLVTVDYH